MLARMRALQTGIAFHAMDENGTVLEMAPAAGAGSGEAQLRLERLLRHASEVSTSSRAELPGLGMQAPTAAVALRPLCGKRRQISACGRTPLRSCCAQPGR